MRILKLSMLFALTVALVAAATPTTPQSDSDLAKLLTHEILMYPNYTVWDGVSIAVSDGSVSLTGAVTQPFKKSAIERIVRNAAGAATIENKIEVAPLSPMDNALRAQVARAIYGDPNLSRYAFMAQPPIHILVENGRVTLFGSVSTEMERNVAGIKASTAGMSFGPVDNRLEVENPPTRKSRSSPTTLIRMAGDRTPAV